MKDIHANFEKNMLANRGRQKSQDVQCIAISHFCILDTDLPSGGKIYTQSWVVQIVKEYRNSVVINQHYIALIKISLGLSFSLWVPALKNDIKDQRFRDNSEKSHSAMEAPLSIPCLI